MTTREAFEKLINSRTLDINENTIKSYKKRLRENRLSTDLMEKILIRSGATKIPEKWKLPKIK